MGLPQKSFSQLVSDMVATWATQLGFQPTFQAGDAFYAEFEAVSSQIIFLESIIQLVNYVARASTCGSDLNNGTTDADLDSFYAQFNFPRQQGVAASGPVTLSKFTPASSQVLVFPGGIVQTQGGALQYTIIADTNQPTWSPTLGAYVLQVGQSSLLASVVATQVGASYNVAANQISQIGSNIAGIDSVTNAEPFSNGQNAESNPAYRARFVQYLNSLAKATLGAIQSAVSNVPGVVDSNLEENVDTGGNDHPGEFVAIVDDGTGHPSSALVALVQTAIESVRGFTIEAQAVAVTYLTATTVLSIQVASGYVAETVQGNVAVAVAAAIEATPIGGGILANGVVSGPGWLYVGYIEQAALAVPGVVSVQPNATTINGVQADLAVTGFQAARAGVNNITVGTYVP